jgi:hypothetical protein
MTRDPDAPFKGYPIGLVIAGYVALFVAVWLAVQWIGSW